MTEPTIQPLSPDLLDDYLYFFDHDAFCDNREWASCYCCFYHAPPAEWEARTGEQNRDQVSALIRAGQMHGYLAYVEEKVVVGWCHAAPRAAIATLPHYQGIQVAAADQGGAILCFVVAKDHRHQGIARALLDAACAGFRQQGFTYAEAYPRPQAQGDADNYHGPLQMYLAAGFTPFRQTGKAVIVRKQLTWRS